MASPLDAVAAELLAALAEGHGRSRSVSAVRRLAAASLLELTAGMKVAPRVSSGRMHTAGWHASLTNR